MNTRTSNSKDTPVRRKRAKRIVENSEYASFARRVLKAYGRRVAAGDVEALRELAVFVSDVDAVTREAVAGLREFGYSWQEIASRVGVSRQAAQQRWGTPAERQALDRRLLDAGLGATVATLAAVFADHFPGSPMPPLCPGCGYRYPDKVTDCPTNATVRPQLYRRRAEDQAAIKRLTPDQFADLHDTKVVRTNRAAIRRQATRPSSPLDLDAQPLFDLRQEVSHVDQ
jgi:hypothetical protein